MQCGGPSVFLRQLLALSLLFGAATVADSAGPPAERPGQQATEQGATPARRVLERVQGQSGVWEVYELNGRRVLACDGAIQGATPIPHAPLDCAALVRARDYVGLVPYFRPPARRALVIGLGAGLQAQALEAHGISTHSVEIDAAVPPLARRYFRFSGRVTIDDGRNYLESMPDQQYDVIVLDAFTADQVPDQLMDAPALQLIARRLGPEGIVVLHLIDQPRSPQLRDVLSHLRQAMPHAVVLRSGYGQARQHLYLFAGHRPLSLSAVQRLELYRLGFMGDEFLDVADVNDPLPLQRPDQ